MMHPFSPLLQNEKEKSDDDANTLDDEPSFPLRIKLNNTDIALNVNKSVRVETLKQWILDCHRSNLATRNNDTNNNAPHGANGTGEEESYLRLIVRGRLMAPDSSTLSTFNVSSSDVVHAVLAKEGRGAQARMLRRLNNASTHMTTNGNSVTGRRSLYSNSTNSSSLNRLWRRIGIDATGVVVSHEGDTDSDDQSEEEDLEVGTEGGRGRSERRGFDRLRSTGMTRDEVNIIRSYFARSVNRYIERRRILLRASAQLQNAVGENVRVRLDTGDSANSLLDHGSEESEGLTSVASNNINMSQGRDMESGVTSGDVNNDLNVPNTAVGGEDILLDRRRMEDEWMSTQGPYSEFRINLNTSNPLLLSAISGIDTNNQSLSNILSGSNRQGGSDRNPFSRRINANGDSDEQNDNLIFGSLGPNPMDLPNNNSAFRPFMGSLPSAGTDKDFIWGFILGFFVGFIMLFWVWMPTVPHKQKVGIISGVIFQLGLNLLRNNSQGDVSI